MGSKETPVVASFLGLVKRGACPTCNAPLKKNAGTPDVLCADCGDYLTFGDKTIRQTQPGAVTQAPYFAAPTPWPDMQCPTFGAMSFSVASALTDAILTKNEGTRILEARWPVGCCVCGKATTRFESLNQQVGYAPPNGFKPRQQKQATVIVRGIPHCDEHERGARLNIVMRFGQSDISSVLGLFFRSYAYQVEFRKLNPWKWRG